MDFDYLPYSNSISRRLKKALESLSLVESLELARRAEEFLTANQTTNHDGDLVTVSSAPARIVAAIDRSRDDSVEALEKDLRANTEIKDRAACEEAAPAGYLPR